MANGGQGMAEFANWCVSVDEQVGNHFRQVMTGQTAQLLTGVRATAAIVPGHYASGEKVARALRRLGKPATAALIENRLPTTKTLRSGELGEIYATEWIKAHTTYSVPINRLRWKDHRNMAMRGDDVIGIFQHPQSQRLYFLKAEAKSRVQLTAKVLAEARAGLDKDGGLPSAHALSFISERLQELGNLPLADKIDDAQWKHGIPLQNVQHLLFTFSSNAPDNLLSRSLRAYPGPVIQLGVGLRVKEHQAFIGAVYDQVIANARNA